MCWAFFPGFRGFKICERRNHFWGDAAFLLLKIVDARRRGRGHSFKTKKSNQRLSVVYLAGPRDRLSRPVPRSPLLVFIGVRKDIGRRRNVSDWALADYCAQPEIINTPGKSFFPRRMALRTPGRIRILDRVGGYHLRRTKNSSSIRRRLRQKFFHQGRS